MGGKAVTAETARKLNAAFDVGFIKESTVQWWFQKVHAADESVEDEEGRGRSPSINNDQLRTLFESEPHTTIPEIAQKLGVSYPTDLDHLKYLNCLIFEGHKP